MTTISQILIVSLGAAAEAAPCCSHRSQAAEELVGLRGQGEGREGALRGRVSHAWLGLAGQEPSAPGRGRAGQKSTSSACPEPAETQPQGSAQDTRF